MSSSSVIQGIRRRLLFCGTGVPSKSSNSNSSGDLSALLATIAKISKSSLKQNLIPGLVIQCVALCVVLVYYLVPSTRGVYAFIGALKAEFGLLYSGVATAIFGGIIPFSYVYFSKRLVLPKDSPPSLLCKHIAFNIFFWAWKGIEVDLFYRLQSVMFGSQNSLKVIVVKVCVDQFIMNPLWWAWSSPVFFAWRSSHFQPSFVKYVRAIQWSGFLLNSIGTLLSTWMIWVPTCSFVYALPDSLQMPTFNLVLVFWSLFISAFIGKTEASKSNTDPSSTASPTGQPQTMTPCGEHHFSLKPSQEGTVEVTMGPILQALSGIIPEAKVSDGVKLLNSGNGNEFTPNTAEEGDGEGQPERIV